VAPEVGQLGERVAPGEIGEAGFHHLDRRQHGVEARGRDHPVGDVVRHAQRHLRLDPAQAPGGTTQRDAGGEDAARRQRRGRRLGLGRLRADLPATDGAEPRQVASWMA
jgi:hypothetical protein